MRIRRKIRRWIAAGTIAIVLFILYAIRPTPVLGVDGDSLAHSVIGGTVLQTPCTHRPNDVWTCGRYVGLYDEHPNTNYRVEVDGIGCWSATLIGGVGRKHLSGCITFGAKGGDEDAIEALARRASTSAYRTSLVALCDPHAAADVSQETAVRALRGLKGLRDPEKFDAWVYRITVAEIRRSLAKNQRHDHEPLAVHMTALVSDGMAAAVEDRIWRRAGIREAVEALSDRQRIALALRYVHDLPDPEIAAALNCREGTVRSLLSRSLRTLARHPALVEHAPARPVESNVSLNPKEVLNEC